MKRHKYSAKPTTVDGITFASKAEAKRYGELKLLERAGEISHLKLQPRFELLSPLPAPNTRLICIGVYVADFCYETKGAVVVEDVKGVRTEMYRWKRKHFEAQYGIPITEVTR